MSVISIFVIRAYAVISICIMIIKIIFLCCTGNTCLFLLLLFHQTKTQVQTSRQCFASPKAPVMHSTFISIMMENVFCQVTNTNFTSTNFMVSPAEILITHKLMSDVENSMYQECLVLNFMPQGLKFQLFQLCEASSPRVKPLPRH